MSQAEHFPARSRRPIATLIVLLAATAPWFAIACTSAERNPENSGPPNESAAGADDSGWQSTFELDPHSLSPTGRNRYFVLEPGFQLVLASDDEQVTITVLDETRQVGGVTTRVVEEREEKNGKLVEVSRNFFAISTVTKDVFYFGEDVDVYKHGEVTHPDAWLAGVDGATAGMIMPGTPRIGARHYQEHAPGKAMDRAEVVSTSETLKTPAGTFEGCLRVEESTALEPDEEEYKTYAPDIGLIQDEDLLLVRYGRAPGR